jgi:ribosomal protein S18 acetylase RimI-like enzyme
MEFDDLAEVFELGERLFTPEDRPNLYRIWDEYELLERFNSDGQYCLVAENEHRIIGFVIGALIEKRKSAWKYGYLIWIGVASRIKKRGLGTRLMKKLTDLFVEDGARIMLADTEASNKAALTFLRKNGFGDESDHVYLSRNLKTHSEKKRLKQ